MSRDVAEQFIAFVCMAGLGLILCSFYGPDGPSKARLVMFAMSSFMFFAMPTIMLIKYLVVGIERKLPWSDELRAKIFGGFFLLGGILIQIYASVLDLYN